MAGESGRCLFTTTHGLAGSVSECRGAAAVGAAGEGGVSASVAAGLSGAGSVDGVVVAVPDGGAGVPDVGVAVAVAPAVDGED